MFCQTLIGCISASKQTSDIISHLTIFNFRFCIFPNCDFLYLIFYCLLTRASTNRTHEEQYIYSNIYLPVCDYFSFTGKNINKCRLFLHAVATAVCQLYLALLPLHRVAQHFAKAWNIFRTFHAEESILRRLTKSAVPFLEGVCLILESLSLFLAVVSTLCVAVRHVLQAALFLIVSTARWAQQRLLLSKEDMEEWEREQEKQRKELQKQRGQVEKYVNAVE